MKLIDKLLTPYAKESAKELFSFPPSWAKQHVYMWQHYLVLYHKFRNTKNPKKYTSFVSI